MAFMKEANTVNRRASSMDTTEKLALVAGNMRPAMATYVSGKLFVRATPAKKTKAALPILSVAFSSSGSGFRPGGPLLQWLKVW